MERLFVFNKSEFVLLLLASIIISKNKDAEIRSLYYGDGRIYINNEEINPDDFIHYFDVLRSSDPLNGVISILLENVTFENLRIVYEFIHSFDLDFKALPSKVYKYVSDQSNYLSTFFQKELSFSNKNFFDDIYDCDVVDNEFFRNESLNDKMRVLCVSMEKDNKALWGLYANKFQGFCFEYDRNEIWASIEQQSSGSKILFACEGEVEYDDSFISTISRYFYDRGVRVEIERLSTVVHRCYYKDHSWSFEKEYRFIVFGDLAASHWSLQIAPSAYSFYDIEKKCEKSFQIDYNKPRTIDGKYNVMDGDTLNSIGLDFFLSYLYSVTISANEGGYKKRRKNLSQSCRIIERRKNDCDLMFEWLNYCVFLRTRFSDNSLISIKNQRQYPIKLIVHYSEKYRKRGK